jgi:hypothetical protein
MLRKSHGSQSSFVLNWRSQRYENGVYFEGREVNFHIFKEGKMGTLNLDWRKDECWETQPDSEHP